MPRKEKAESEFHKRLQGSAHTTLKSAKTRKAIEDACAVFAAELPDEGAAWENLCAIRDHVNALIGAYQDLNTARQQQVLSDLRAGKFKGTDIDAAQEMNREVYTVADFHAEVERKRIPEYD
jgi:hypothetical protein